VLLSVEVLRYTADDRQRDWPEDLGFNFVNAIQEMAINWGQVAATGPNV
jgi:hypothetical protein